MLHGVAEGHAIQKDVPRWKYISPYLRTNTTALFPVLQSLNIVFASYLNIRLQDAEETLGLLFSTC